VLLVAVCIGIYLYAGAFGLNLVLLRGGAQWITVSKDDALLSPSMRLALSETPPKATAGDLTWKEIAPGFEAGELPVLAGSKKVDSILLARIDPARFKFIVRISPPGDKELGDWMDKLGAVMAVNGSYFTDAGWPATPLVSAGRHYGPKEYRATHGAFVSAAAAAAVHDLADKDWRDVVKGSDDAMVSYPLLVDANGLGRSKGDDRWLANRNFVAEDKSGRIVIGTTTDAFFSLNRLAEFLRTSPLDLAAALNLDGGPVACQGIRLGGFERDFCGDWELYVQDGELKLLARIFGNRRWTLPIVFAVLPK